MTEMDFSTNSFVRLCSLDCELKPVDVVSDKQIWKSKICLCFWEFYMQMFSLWPEVVLGQFGCIFWGVLQTFSDSVMTSLIKIFLMDQFIK